MNPKIHKKKRFMNVETWPRSKLEIENLGYDQQWKINILLMISKMIQGVQDNNRILMLIRI